MIDPVRLSMLQAMEIPVWVSRDREELQAQQPPPQQSQSPASPPQTGVTDWQTLDDIIINCQRCELSKTRCNAVPGVGPESVDLCIIGEAPGAEEDRQGKPFVGRAGQLLTQMLAAIDCPRESVFIGNILKCRPPGNRDPKPEEIAQCLPYLQQQLNHLKPKALLLVGRIAAQTLLETDQPMRRLRQQTFEYGEAKIPVVVTYHPAYLLRQPSEKAKALEDLLRLRALID